MHLIRGLSLVAMGFVVLAMATSTSGHHIVEFDRWRVKTPEDIRINKLSWAKQYVSQVHDMIDMYDATSLTVQSGYTSGGTQVRVLTVNNPRRPQGWAMAWGENGQPCTRMQSYASGTPGTQVTGLCNKSTNRVIRGEVYINDVILQVEKQKFSYPDEYPLFVILHEMGHVVGLGHGATYPCQDSVMRNANNYSCSPHFYWFLTSGDSNHINLLYQ
jgi:hypothetical protein